MIKYLKIVMSLILSTLVLTSCVSNTVENVPNQGSSAQATASITTPPTIMPKTTVIPETTNNDNPTARPILVSDGPVLARFTSTSSAVSLNSVEQVDTSLGTTRTIFENCSNSEVSTSLNLIFSQANLGGWYREQMFDPLLTRIAVNWLEESDGSRHVGWLDENGALIDVTSLLSKGNSEFSKRPQHFNALFDAKGNFLFVDETTGMLNRYDLNNMTTVGKSSKVENSYGVIPYTIMLQPDGSIDTQLSDRLLTFCDLKLPNKIKISSNASYIIGGDGGVSIQDLIDDNRVLVMSQSENLKVAGIKGLKKNNSSENDIEDIVENIEPITIATDYKIENAAVSGDGKQIAFVAQRGQDRSLFVMPIDGSAEPKKVFEIDNLTFLLFWK